MSPEENEYHYEQIFCIQKSKKCRCKKYIFKKQNQLSEEYEVHNVAKKDVEDDIKKIKKKRRRNDKKAKKLKRQKKKLIIIE